MNKLEKYINDFENYEIPKTMKATVLLVRLFYIHI